MNRAGVLALNTYDHWSRMIEMSREESLARRGKNIVGPPFFPRGLASWNVFSARIPSQGAEWGWIMIFVTGLFP